MSSLFRKQAVQHATHRLAGEVILASPLSLKVLSALLILFIAAALLLASVATYTRKETVSGWIVPANGLIRVEAREPGVVEKLLSDEGAIVKAGAPLAVIHTSAQILTGDVGQELERDLRVEGTAKANEAQASALKLRIEQLAMQSRRVALVRELEEMNTRIGILQQRQKLNDNQLLRASKLMDRGFLAPQQFDQFQLTALSTAQDVSQSKTAALELESQISSLDAQLSAFPAELANIEAQAAQARASMQQRRITAQSQATFVATAPIAGQVLVIPVELGQAVPAGGTVAIINPRNSVLTAELYVPSRSAGLIQPGQEVHLMYQSFPYQTFGTGRGVISDISRTVLAPSELAIPGLIIHEPVFRVRVRLDSSYISAYSHRIGLEPGMLLSADVITDRRNLIQWILDPLYAEARR